MQKTTLYLDEELVLALRQLARAQGRSQAELIRQALKDYAARHQGRRRFHSLAVGKSGHRDTAERADELLRAAAERGQWP